MNKMLSGTVLNINKNHKTFTLCSDDTVQNIKYDKIYNLILNTKIVFQDTSLIFTYIDDLRGEALRNIVRKYCYKYEIKKFETQIYNLLYDISKPYYTENSIIDGILMMCILVLSDEVKAKDLFKNKKQLTFDVIKNNIFLWIYREVGVKFMRLLGIDRVPNYKMFLYLYETLKDPIYEIKRIDRKLFINLNSIFEYDYTQELMNQSLSARRLYESMKQNGDTCVPLKNFEFPLSVYSKFGFIVRHDALIHQASYDKQVTISKFLSSINVMLMHGPPGSGKTFNICKVIESIKGTYRILAPTGKACDNLRAKLPNDIKVSTIHKYIHHQEFNKNYNIMIIDESSMISLNLFYKLIQKLLDSNVTVDKLVLVGDPNQLEPINRGDIFRMMIESKIFKSIKLEFNFRSENTSSIAINQKKLLDGDTDFIFDEQFRINRQGTVEDLIDKLKDIQDYRNVKIISPYRETVSYVNERIRNILFKEDEKIAPFFVGELVICIKNLYKAPDAKDDFDVMNGEEGIVTEIKKKDTETKVLVDFGCNNGKIVSFSTNELSEKPLLYLKTAYAITIHASQGSEWQNVILVVPRRDSNFKFINMNMIYTAISRPSTFIEIYCDNFELYAKKKKRQTNHRFEQILKEYNYEQHSRIEDTKTVEDSIESSDDDRLQFERTSDD